MKNIRMEDMNWFDISKATQKGFTTVVIGIGSTEQHGPHLPTHTDAIIADILANRVASKLGNALQAQTIRIGCSDYHLSFPGTISLKKETLKAILFDYVDSLFIHGFKTIIFISSHGGNFKPTQEAINEIQSKYPTIKVIGYADLMSFWKVLWEIAQRFGISKEEAGGHAGEIETSQMLSIAESQVMKDRLEPGYIGAVSSDTNKILFEKGMPALSKIGVIGDPTRSDINRGHIYMEKLVDYFVQNIKKLNLD
ncbi:MAG: creatininase family protein [Promethearchaeia archaeon]